MRKNSASIAKLADSTEDAPKIVPLGFVSSPLNPSLLTQPIRQNRARPHLPENPENHRDAITQIRTMGEECCRFFNLNAYQFQSYLKEGLHGLPLEEPTRQHILERWANAPDDSRFWRTIQEADRIAWPPSLDVDDHKIWSGDFFHERFSEYQLAPSAGWIQLAVDILFVLHAIKGAAWHQISERSMLLFYLHQQKKEHGNYSILIEAAREWLPAPWVEQEKTALRRQLLFGTPQEQQSAQQVLLDIAEAETSLGKGPVEQFSKEEQQVRKRESTRTSGAKRNQQQVVKRLVEKAKTDEQWNIENREMTLEQAKKEADRYVTKQFKKTSPAINKKAILSIFKEIRKSD